MESRFAKPWCPRQCLSARLVLQVLASSDSNTSIILPHFGFESSHLAQPTLTSLIMAAKPETHYFPSTGYAPNNQFPVIVYRGILPRPVTEETATEYLTRNKWHKLVIPHRYRVVHLSQPDTVGHRVHGATSPNRISIPTLMNATVHNKTSFFPSSRAESGSHARRYFPGNVNPPNRSHGMGRP